MTALGYISLSLAAALLVAFGESILYQHAHAKGYAQGKKDESDWWSRAELESDEVRKKLWREEAQK